MNTCGNFTNELILSQLSTKSKNYEDIARYFDNFKDTQTI